jgi:glycosyltransferase involved in cell wall biosynthesis
MKLSLVIPFYNEEKAAEEVIQDLLNEFRKSNLEFELILINNGSVDKTPDILRKLSVENPEIKLLTVSVNQGFGWGVINGLMAAKADYVGFMPGDGQLKARDTVKVYEKLVSENLDLCKGKRVTREDGLARQIQSRVFNFILPLFFRVHTKDINGCPKIMKYRSLLKLDLHCKDWFLDTEIMVKAHNLKFSTGEVPVAFNYRHGGRSKVRVSSVFEFLGNMLKYKLKGF